MNFFSVWNFEFLQVFNSKAIKVSYIISIHMLGFKWEPVVLYLLIFITDLLFFMKIYYLFVVTLLKGTYFSIIKKMLLFLLPIDQLKWKNWIKELNNLVFLRNISQCNMYTLRNLSKFFLIAEIFYVKLTFFLKSI